MRIIDRIRGLFTRSILDNPAARPTWDEVFNTQSTSTSGESVSLVSAIGYPAFRQAVTLLSGDVAKVPLSPYRRNVDGSSQVDESHGAYRAVRHWASETQAAFTFWRHMMIHALIWSHAYAWILRDQNGRIESLVPLLSDRTTRLPDGSYLSEINGKREFFHASEIFHLQGMCFGDGDDCKMLQDCRDTIGLGLAANGFAARFFKNGGRMGGVLEVPAEMGAKSRDGLETGWRKTYENKEAQFRTVILRDNAKFHSAQFDPDKGQMTLSRQEQVKEVARIFNLPAHKLGHDGRTAYNSLEMEERSYLNSSLSHWFRAIEAEAGIKLMSSDERMSISHEFGHDVSELLASDSETRSSVGEREIRMGAINPNEYRARLKLPPREGGDVYQNLGGVAIPEPETEPETEEVIGPQENSSLIDAVERTLAASVGIARRRIRDDVAREIRRKSCERFVNWFDTRFPTVAGEIIEKHTSEAAEAVAIVRGISVEDVIDGLKSDHQSPLSAGISDVLATCDRDSYKDSLLNAVDAWKDAT